MDHSRRVAVEAAITFLVLCSTACGGDTTAAITEAADGSIAAAIQSCSFGTAVRDAKGVARLALLVGVGAYKHDSIRKLHGPPNDVALMQELLSGPGGYGFPENNVCSLVDAAATGANFRRAFDKTLVKRAKPGDVVVIYFSGHGTQLPDTNHDESDLSDEVLMFADSRTPTASDLRDDEFATLLKPLRATSGNVVVILDSCNSGSATRFASDTLIPRSVEPRPEDLKIVENAAAPRETDSAVEFVGSGPGLITISAAIDGTVALEKSSSGVFTKSLVSVLSQVTSQPLTYRQLARKVPPLVAATSTQISSFEGDLDQVVFGAEKRTRPLALEVVSVAQTIKLGGTLVPGVGKNAELRVFDSSFTGTDLNDPAKSKAMLIVDSANGLNAEARKLTAPPNAAPVAPGDLAVLVRPSDETIAMQVRIRPATEVGGVPAERTAKLRSALAGNAEANMLVKLREQLADFEVTLDASGRYNLLGPEGRIRNVQSAEDSVVTNLWLHARQRAFLNLRSESGGELNDDSSLSVTVEPSNKPQRSCVRPGATLSRDAKGTYIIPLCYGWQIHVKLAASATTPLRIGGLLLSSDGSVYGFPKNNSIATISPGGAEVVFDTTFHGSQPVGINDYLLVFGTRLENGVDWAELTETAASRGVTNKSPLHRALDNYLRAAGSRGQSIEETPYDDTAWTRTVVAMRTEANPAFEAGALNVNPGSREYTIKEFDIRPYLPDDQNTPLYRVLRRVDWLARQDVSYQQHDWNEASDAQNLVKGIDCSRAIWFSFTRSNLKYNSGNDYVATAGMVKDDSRMSEQFEHCPLGENYETGDLLVYRDETQGDGHIVMVIDPARRIAWGSHGWDGNAKAFNVPPDTGVEYQLIKYKKDWERWDRKTMALKACWRYKDFTAARSRGMGSPGLNALGTDPCSAESCNANQPPP